MPRHATETREHDPGVAEARARVDGLDRSAPALMRVGNTDIRFGTASWTDPTLVAPGVFYPDRATSAEARLKYYASQFSVVEVDSTYYALPTRRVAELWVERTPVDFVFDVKAFGWMTSHPTETARLPRVLQDALPDEAADRKRLYPKDVPPELRDEAWRIFADAITPLHGAGKLGAVFLQYPPWVRPAAHSAEMLARARRRLGALPIAIEFRHGDWLAPVQRERTFAMLRDNGMSYVVVDEPQGFASSVPPDVAITSSPLAVVRLHGRRGETWEKRGTSVLERFRYLYSEEELAGWVPKIVEIAGEAEQVHVVFNNCYGNYGTTNALEMGRAIGVGR
ncbi:MAG TPA: DUF72 domain-containing protein [Gemmatimonadaceae bacterium]|nr:DUF72 domain-containing protein [Gemmatimonadaceae bacterium]